MREDGARASLRACERSAVAANEFLSLRQRERALFAVAASCEPWLAPAHAVQAHRACFVRHRDQRRAVGETLSARGHCALRARDGCRDGRIKGTMRATSEVRLKRWRHS